MALNALIRGALDLSIQFLTRDSVSFVFKHPCCRTSVPAENASISERFNSTERSV